jgi:PadR family transcriptional regulator PadR
MKGQALKGHLDLLLLAVVSDGPKHGYAVVEELKVRSGETFDLPEGTVYPALYRLEQSGYLSSEWSVSSGRRRRNYQLTKKGQKAAVEHRRSWDEFTEAMTGVLRSAQWAPTT